MKNINFTLSNFEYQFLYDLYDKQKFHSVNEFCLYLVSGYVDFILDHIVDDLIDNLERGSI